MKVGQGVTIPQRPSEEVEVRIGTSEWRTRRGSEARPDGYWITVIYIEKPSSHDLFGSVYG